MTNSIVGRLAAVRFRYKLLLAAISSGSFLMLILNNSTDIFGDKREVSTIWYSTHRYDPFDSGAGFTIKTEGCTIPDLHPFDESIRKFIEYPTHLKPCKNKDISLLKNNETHIWLAPENIEYPSVTNITCCYKAFYRPLSISDISSADIDDRVKYDECVYFYDYIEVTNEFVKVSCTNHDKVILYEQFYIFAMKKPFLSYKEDSTEAPINQSGYNVLVMGIDAISRLNFYRTMPKTLSYLKKKGAIELFGYNKVGDNTFPNLIPILLGIRDTDLKRTCWPNVRATFDNCPFIWDWFKEAGYFTALGEDSASLGTFNFEKLGFSGTPTDYYIRTFVHEAELRVGNNKDFNSFICMGNKYFYQVLLDYIEDLTKTLKSSKLFGFFWEVTMSHDYLNYPVIMDESYETFLKHLDISKYLEDTILILLSDHGIRWGDIRLTKQGRLEERLPLVHILLPTSFRENYALAYDNLKLNSRRLTTPFDLYATLSDLVNMDSIKNDKVRHRSSSHYAQDRSISLFLPIPSNRTCSVAGIDDHWCTCLTGRRISTTSKEASAAGAVLVRQLNVMLRPHRQCQRLLLAKILEVTEMEVGKPEDYEVGWREFIVTVRTAPGDGLFEATVRRRSGGWLLAGTVSRLNLYGDQSHCVHDAHLKLYCFCR
ncbi:hypothetical protein RR48_02628 [Papilio machaon]|uniref:Uncharacterized protein n=1 Tax=Papilio machaon TaxID=76193 RepID=A0A0N1INZ4_PAPMA|nr:hypothetical protein RR48_02628 [Papilio machaon]